MSVHFYLLGPLQGSLWQVFVDYGSTNEIWQHVAKGSTQARALWGNKQRIITEVNDEKAELMAYTIIHNSLCLGAHALLMPNNTVNSQRLEIFKQI